MTSGRLAKIHLRFAFCLLFSVLGGLTLRAQALDWAKSIGSVNDDQARSLVTDPDGNVYLGGHFVGTMDFDPGPGVVSRTAAGSSDLFIAKYNPAGDLLWVDVMGSAFADEVNEIRFQDGYLYLCGQFIGNSDMDPGAGTLILFGSGSDDAFFAKYRASDGSVVWARSLGSGSSDIATTTAVDGRGNVYVGGEFTSTLDLDPGAGTTNVTTAGVSDGFVAKYDSLGQFIWGGQLGGSFFDYLFELEVDTAGAVFVTGSFGTTADMDLMAGVTNLVSAGGQDIYFCKYTKNGNLVWAQRYGGASNDEGHAVDISPAMHLVVTGYFAGTIDFNGNAGVNNVSSRGGSIDVFVARYDTAGNYMWAFSVGDGADDRGYGIRVTSDGVVYVTGYIFGTADFDPGPAIVNVTADFRDPFLARYDAAGNFSWAFTIFGGNGDRGLDIEVDATGRVLGTGFFRLTSDFAPGAATFNQTSNGLDDIYLAKYIPCQEPTATTQPQVATACAGGNASFSFNYTGPADSTRWYRSTDEGASWQRIADGGIYAGAATTTLSLTGAAMGDNATWYRAVLYSCIRAADTTSAAPLYVITPSAAFYPLPQDACENAEPITFTPYQFGLQFDATLDYLTASDVATGNFVTGDFTLEMWVNTTASGTSSYLLTKGLNGGCVSSLSLGLSATGKVTFDLADAGCVNTVSLTGATSVNTGTWRHIAATRSGTTVQVFVDGVLDGTASSASTISLNNAEPLIVGSSTQAINIADASSGFNGQLDEIRLWAYAKGPTELAALRRLPLQGNEDYLRALWSFNEGPGVAIAQDRTAGNSDLTLTGFSLSSDWVWTNTHLLTWNWNFGDAGTSTTAIPSHTYAASNTYIASLNATTPAGCSANSTEPVYVVKGPSASWTSTSLDTCVGDTIVFTPDQFGLRFDGVDESATASPAFSAAAAFTYEAWIRKESATGTDQVLWWNGTAGSNGFGLLVNAAGNLALRVFGSPDATTSFSPALNVWTHVVITYDMVNWQCFVNGMPQALSGNPALSVGVGTFRIGGSGLPGEYFTGTLDEVRCWSLARTQQQVQAYRERSLAGTETGLLAAYDMNLDRPSSTVNNQVVSGPDLSLVNMEGSDYVWTNPLAQTWQWRVNEVAMSTDSILHWPPPLSGVFEIKLTATSTRGCTLSDSANVVGDTVKPSLVCKNITLYLDGAGNAAITPSSIDNGTADACGIDSLWISKYSFTCADTGAVAVRLVARDNAQLRDSCLATVTVRDTLNPVQACQNLTVHLDAAGNAAITPAMVDAGSTDNCGIASRTLSQTSFTCANVGANLVTLRLRDVSGNRDSCAATITVLDTVRPTALCQNLTAQLNALGTVTITPAMVSSGSADACGISSLSLDLSSFTCAEVGGNTVTLTVTDANGNLRTCAATITVQDTVKPSAICQNLTRYLDAAGNASITPAAVDNGSADACGIASRTLDITAFTCADVGANPVVLTINDVNGNTRNCAATITVLDTVKANALCQDLTVWLDSTGNASTSSAAVNNGSNDACGIASLSLSTTSFTCADLGANPVTLTVTDVNGNVSSCSANVTVSDSIDIYAGCRNVTLYLDGSGNAALVPAQVDSASWDNCGIASSNLNATAFDCSDVGSNPVTLTVQDPFGNMANCISSVTVLDTIRPTLTCNNLSVFLDMSGNATLTPAAVLATSGDNCGTLPATLSQTDFTCADAGMVTDTLFISDVNGNTRYCLSTLNVQENVPPTALCRNLTVYLDSAGTSSVTGAALDNGSTDNCAITSRVPTPSTFGCGNLGANLSQVVMSDASGNRDTCVSTITVMDTIAVSAVCRNLTLYLNGAGTAGIDSSMVNNGSYDNCGLVTMALSDNAFSCADVGPNSVTLTVTNPNGSSDACSSTITVQDTTRANAVCRDLTVQLSALGSASITPAMVDNGSTDNCGIASRALSLSAFTCANVGPNPVTLTVTDVNGNLSTCLSTVTVQDTVRPIALCKAVSLVLDSAGTAALSPAEVNNGSSDACGIAGLSLSATSFGCANVGPNTVTLTVSDANGNQRTCTSTVTVQDTIDVFVACNDTVVYLSATGSVTLDTSFVAAAWWDNCAVTGISMSQSVFTCADVEYLFLEYADQSQLSHNDISAEDRYWQSFISTMTGELTRLRILDSSSTTHNLRIYQGTGTAGLLLHSQTFASVGGWANVVIPPGVNVTAGGQYTFEVERITAPAQPVYSNLNPYVSGLANLNGFTGISNNLDIAFESFITVGTLFPDVPITLTATDAHGNSGTCTATVTVLDTLLPAAACSPATLYLDATGGATASATIIGAGSADNCGIDSVWLSQRNFTCAHLGTNNPTLFARDTEGNVTSCVATVTVLDTLNPNALCAPFVAQLDSGGTATLLASMADAGSTDNCGITIRSISPSSFNCADLGSQSVTLTLTDASGNSSNCTTNVTIADTIAPQSLSCPADFSVSADSSDCSPAVSWAAPTFTDNCGFAVVASHLPGDAFSIGSTVVTYTATDSSGLDATCTFTVTVNPQPFAVDISALDYGFGYGVSCQGLSDGVLEAHPTGGCLPYSYAWSTGAVSDSIGGLSAGVYAVTVTDGRGLTASDTFSITEPAQPQLALDTILHETCPGLANGEIQLTTSGGVPLYAHLWSDGFVGEDHAGLNAGTYSVTLTDAMGCTLADTFVVPGDSLVPVAAFSYDSTGTPTWLFTDLSTGGVGSWLWTFGDGDSSSLQNPSHTFDTVGFYTVTLVVTSPCGSDTLSQTVFVDTLTQVSGGLSAQVRVSPNPTHGDFTVELIGWASQEAQISLTDLAGRVLLTHRMRVRGGNALWQGSLADLPQGIYLLEVRDAQRRFLTRVVRM